MGYTFAADHDQLVVRYFGDPSPREIEAARQDAAAFVVARTVRRILVDTSAMTPSLALGELFDSRRSRFSLLPKDVAVALVYDPAILATDDALRAQGAGDGPTVRVFARVDEADEWLGSLERTRPSLRDGNRLGC
jgi:hypothetical protein